MFCLAGKLARIASLSGLAVLFAATLCSQPSVLTWHNDNFRTGQNLQETILTPTNVKSSTFGRLFTIGVDGKVDAQPLYVPHLTIPGQGVHNVLYVATEHNSVYGFDADNGAQLLFTSLSPGTEATSDVHNCPSQVSPEIGITATPVIDPTSGPHGTIYVVAMTKDLSNAYHQRIHALDLTTLAEEFGGPTEIVATSPGSPEESTFLPGQHMDRAALLLSQGVVYTTWSSHCDARPYVSWVIGYSATTLARTSVLNLEPKGIQGGIWAAGSGPAADNAGNVYVPTGNGTFDTTLLGNGMPSKGNFGNAFVKMSTNGSLAVVDYFTMSNTVSETGQDTDLGSGGGMLLPPLIDSGGHARDLAVVAGKDSNIYVMDRNNLGKFNPNANEIYQPLSGVLAGGMWSSPAWFNGSLYYAPQGNVLKAFFFSNGKFGTNPSSQSSATFQYPGTTPSVSANGTSNGIVWASSNGSAILHAYSATNLGNELYNSNQAAGGRDHFGSGNKFIVPTIVNGKVYVASNGGVAGKPGSVAVFGLLGQQSDFSLAIAPNAKTIAPGASATYSIDMTGQQGFSGTVTFGVSGLPSGASGGFNPASLSGSGSTTLTIMSGSAAPGTYTFTVTGNSGAFTHQVSATVIVAIPTAASATFVTLDTNTQGNWRGVYGGDGYVVIQDQTVNPTYVTPMPAGQSQVFWTNSTADVRALQKASNPSDRIAGVWYSSTSFTIDLSITDGNSHEVALYCVDWDRLGRSQTVDILDSNGSVLDTESLSSFGEGAYLVWNVSGHVKIRVTLVGGGNAVATGLFFSGPAVISNAGTASFVKQDTTTKGNWQGAYGADGYVVIADRTSNPNYVSPVASGQNQVYWTNSTSDVRALEKASNPSDRIAGVWYSATSFTVDMPIRDNNTHQVALYCVDWDSGGRSETVDLLDGVGNVLNTQTLSNFTGGVYLVWNVSGHVKIRITLTGGWNAVMTGLFFGGANVLSNSGTASFVTQDTTTKGNWRTVYGTDGYVVVEDQTLNPTYVAPAATGQSEVFWTNSTSDPRALQKATNPSDRIAGVWFAANSFTVDLNITDGNTHQLAVYCLDWDHANRAETLEIIDTNSTVLDSQSLSNFSGGTYVIWNISGHVKLRVTLTGGWNAVLSGLFFH